jgi:hypothetical protein
LVYLAIKTKIFLEIKDGYIETFSTKRKTVFLKWMSSLIFKRMISLEKEKVCILKCQKMLLTVESNKKGKKLPH